MQSSHLIVVGPDGSMQFTRHADLDIVFGGRGRMHRVTDITKVPDKPIYTIRWLDGPFEGQTHTVAMAKQYGVAKPDADEDVHGLPLLVSFCTYDEAVAHERKMLDAMRLAGVKFR